MKKEKHAYKCRFQSLFPPLLSMVAYTLVEQQIEDSPKLQEK